MALFLTEQLKKDKVFQDGGRSSTWKLGKTQIIHEGGPLEIIKPFQNSTKFQISNFTGLNIFLCAVKSIILFSKNQLFK